MKTIEEIRAAFLAIHDYATKVSARAYMSIPADPDRDADLIVSAAIDELAASRAEVERLKADLKQGTTNALNELDKANAETARAEEKLAQFESYAITVDSALRDREQVERLTRERDEATARAEFNDVTAQAWHTRTEAAEEREAALREALRAIAESPHCSYDVGHPLANTHISIPEDRQYQIGVADGHRCAAETARAALSSTGGAPPEPPESEYVVTGRHDNQARRLLGTVYRHRLGQDGSYPEIGVVEAANAQRELASALSWAEFTSARVQEAVERETEACIHAIEQAFEADQDVAAIDVLRARLRSRGERAAPVTLPGLTGIRTTECEHGARRSGCWMCFDTTKEKP